MLHQHRLKSSRLSQFLIDKHAVLSRGIDLHLRDLTVICQEIITMFQGFLVQSTSEFIKKMEQDQILAALEKPDAQQSKASQ